MKKPGTLPGFSACFRSANWRTAPRHEAKVPLTRFQTSTAVLIGPQPTRRRERGLALGAGRQR